MNHLEQIIFSSDIKESLSLVFNTIDVSQTVILVDSNTANHCLPLLDNDMVDQSKLLIIPAGESYKSIHTVTYCWEKLNEWNIDRNSVLINLGGGMISDIGGFVASTFKRGIQSINIPTSLLAMVDASVGMKTGLNFSDTKNLIGTFKQPESVIIYPTFLKTLPENERLSGYAEMIKHALITSQEVWEDTKQIDLNTLDDVQLTKHIRLNLIIKQNYIHLDPFDNNKRRILNFGHTFGHAIESFFQNHENYLRHGEAVAIGMMLELYLSYIILQFPYDLLNEICTFIQSKYKMPEILNEKEIWDIMNSDKKNSFGKNNFTLLKNIGQPKYNIIVEKQLFTKTIKFYQQLFNNKS